MNGANEPLIFTHLREERPNPKQIEFFRSTALYTMYGGARGGGKSWAARRKAVLLCMRYPALKALIVRRTYTELRNNHILPLTAELNGYARYSDKEKSFVFPNGSRLQLGFCDNDGDMLQFQGAEYDAIFFEEATNLREEWITFIQTSLRTTRTDFKPRVYYTCNPGGVSHAYFKRLFIDRQFNEQENPADYLFIPATVKDNTVLMDANPEYIKQLEALPEAKRRAHLYGEWDVFEGAFFSEFRTECKPLADAAYTHVVEPFRVPQSWRVYRSFDWGYSKPFDCTWYAVDYDGRAYAIRQFYGCQKDRNGVDVPNTGLKWTADQVFAKIHEIEQEDDNLRDREIHGVADPAIWAEDGGEAIIAAADRHQVYFDKGDHTRKAGWMQVRYRIAFDEDGKPMLYYFSNCKSAIRTLPLMQYDKHDAEDLDTALEDHHADSLRYFCMSIPLAPTHEIKPTYKPYDPLTSKRKVERI